jgi:hypothetical protein
MDKVNEMKISNNVPEINQAEERKSISLASKVVYTV